MVRIVADTTSSLPVDLAKKLDIPLLPQIIVFGDQSFRDDYELDTPTFLKKLKQSSTLPKTAAPPPALYLPVFQECVDRGETVIVIAPSAELSGTERSATVAARDFPGADIRVIDSRTIAGGLGYIVLQAHQWAKDGMDADTLEKKIKALAARERVYFIVDTLEYLYKGGRIGGAQALFGSIMQIKPILMLKNGKTEAVEKQRTKRTALKRVSEIVLENCAKGPEAHISVMHCDAEKEAKEFATHFEQELGIQSIPIYLVPPAIVVHAGPRVIAVSSFIPE